MFTGQISGSDLRPLADLIAQAKRPTAMAKELGRRGTNELKAWFRQRNRTPNRMGGRRSNLWARIADSVHQPQFVGTSKVQISVTHPVIMQKIKGGRITAKRHKYLTLARVPEAYDRTVAVFQRETGIVLQFVKIGGVAMMIQAMGRGAFRVVYLLKTSVDQEADPNALPPKAQWLAALLDQATKHLNRQNRSATSSPA